jgi:hypothetical protein
VTAAGAVANAVVPQAASAAWAGGARALGAGADKCGSWYFRLLVALLRCCLVRPVRSYDLPTVHNEVTPSRPNVCMTP